MKINGFTYPGAVRSGKWNFKGRIQEIDMNHHSSAPDLREGGG